MHWTVFTWVDLTPDWCCQSATDPNSTETAFSEGKASTNFLASFANCPWSAPSLPTRTKTVDYTQSVRKWVTQQQKQWFSVSDKDFLRNWQKRTDWRREKPKRSTAKYFLFQSGMSFWPAALKFAVKDKTDGLSSLQSRNAQHNASIMCGNSELLREKEQKTSMSNNKNSNEYQHDQLHRLRRLCPKRTNLLPLTTCPPLSEAPAHHWCSPRHSPAWGRRLRKTPPVPGPTVVHQ